MTDNKVCENCGGRHTCPYAVMDNVFSCVSWVPDKSQHRSTNSGGNYSGIASVPEDIVNHPSHYETGKFECIDVMRETQGDEAVQNFCICNAQKYIYRHRNKNGVEDIRKAKWYIDKYLEIEEEKDARSNTTIHE